MSAKKRPPADQVGEGPTKAHFTSFQPKKFRPQRGKHTVSPQGQNSSVKNSPQGSDAHGQAGKQNKQISIEEAQVRLIGSVIFAQDIPDEATYKTEIEIISNFNVTSAFSPHSYGPQQQSNWEADNIINTLHQRWKFTQTVWSYPQVEYPLSVYNENRVSEMLVQKAMMVDMETKLSRCAEAVLSVSQLFFDNMLDTFLLYIPSESFSRQQLAANFYKDMDVESSELVHSCVLKSVDASFMRRLKKRFVKFEVLASSSNVYASTKSDEITTLSEDNYIPESSIPFESISSTSLYKVRVLHKCSVAAAIDVIMEYSFAQFSSGASLKYTPLQIVSSKPFSHSIVHEAVPTLMQHIGFPQGSERNDIQDTADLSPSSYRISFRGFISCEALDALAALLTALALKFQQEKVSGLSSLIPLGRDVPDEQFFDSAPFDPSFLKLRKSKMGKTTTIISGLKDPMQLTVAKRDSDILGISSSERTSAYGSKNQYPSFRIVATGYVGVPFLSGVRDTQESKLSPHGEQCLYRGFLFKELSWNYCGDIKNSNWCNYRIILMRQPLDKVVCVVNQNETESKCEEEDCSIVLKPLNAYSKYAE